MYLCDVTHTVSKFYLSLSGKTAPQKFNKTPPFGLNSALMMRTPFGIFLFIVYYTNVNRKSLHFWRANDSGE